MNILQKKLSFQFGAPLATFLFMLSLYWRVWDTLDETGRVVLTLCLVVTFLSDFEWSHKTEVKP